MMHLLLACSDYDLFLDGKDPADPGEETAPSDTAVSTTDTDPDTDTDPETWAACVDRSFPEGAVEVIHPPDVTATYDPTVSWSTTNGYTSTFPPIVGRLVDTDGDGALDTSDVPCVVQWRVDTGTVEALRGDDGTQIWAAAFAYYMESTIPAIADIDGDGWPEVLSAGGSGLAVYNGQDGALKRFAGLYTGTGDAMPRYVTVADLDGDGTGEVLVGATLLNSDMSQRGTLSGGLGATLWMMAPAVGDLDGDGRLEIIGGNTVYDDEGRVLLSMDRVDGTTAVGDLDGDGDGDVVVVNEGEVYAYTFEGTLLGDIVLPEVSQAVAAVADFDGDGSAEIGIGTEWSYVMLDGDGTLLWSAPTEDDSSWYTSSAAFDFDGDGVDEVVYADEHDVWIFDGPTGAVRMQYAGHTSATGPEYATVADVDGDGSADILFGNDGTYGPEVGLRVINDPTWPGTRGVWNQYAYLPELVDEVGGLVPYPTMGWATGDTRYHGQPSDVAPSYLANLTVSVADVCITECVDERLSVWAQLANDGTETVTSSFDVTLWGYGGAEPVMLATTRWTVPIPAGAQTEGFEWEVDPMPAGVTALIVRVDEAGEVEERTELDNEARYGDTLCE